jgi:hypothetical protein
MKLPPFVVSQLVARLPRPLAGSKDLITFLCLLSGGFFLHRE